MGRGERGPRRGNAAETGGRGAEGAAVDVAAARGRVLGHHGVDGRRGSGRGTGRGGGGGIGRGGGSRDSDG